MYSLKHFGMENINFKTWVKTRPRWCDQPPDFGQLLKRTLPQNSRSNVTYVVPVTVKCSYCTPDDGRGECPKHVVWSCNKTNILLLHLVGYLYTYVENDARYHERKNNNSSLLTITLCFGVITTQYYNDKNIQSLSWRCNRFRLYFHVTAARIEENGRSFLFIPRCIPQTIERLQIMFGVKRF
jgi:hypothetical protein